MKSNPIYATTLVLVTSVGLLAACSKNEPVPATSTKAPPTTVGTELDDTVITTKVKAALLEDKDVKGLDVKVETRKGEVQLSGFVDNQAQIDRAVVLVKGIQGVKNVANSMSVKK